MKPNLSTGPLDGPTEKHVSMQVERVHAGRGMALRLLRLSPWPGPDGLRQAEPGARVFAFGEGATVMISVVRTPQQAFDMGAALLVHLNEARQHLRGRRARQLNNLASALSGLPEELDLLSAMLPPVQDCGIVSHGKPAAYLAIIAAFTLSLRRATAMAEGMERAMLQHLFDSWGSGYWRAVRATRISLPAPDVSEGLAHG